MFDEDLSLRHGFLSRDVWMGFLPFNGSSHSTVRCLARWSSMVPLGLAKTIPGCRPGFSVTLHSCPNSTSQRLIFMRISLFLSFI
ncbi:hypothetical protein Scep_030178 [Stephania cephalantha]|uniref:Uncharacterized protein n=1 Tax=Stephania cephalantha TaxID=152367 RepID=A0AAP0E2N4_9MAGN